MAVVLVVVYAVGFLASTPSTVAAASGPGGARLTLQTVAAFGHSPHPDWVSYLVKDPKGRWRHSTVFQVPAHSLVHVTLYQYDTATGLRNPFWSQVRGTVGGTMTVDGKTMGALPPDDAKNQCSAAPCTLAEAHTTITFTIRTGKPGKFRWQCFVPCAAAFIFGNGGPMQSVGWMDGYLHVV